MSDDPVGRYLADHPVPTSSNFAESICYLNAPEGRRASTLRIRDGVFERTEEASLDVDVLWCFDYEFMRPLSGQTFGEGDEAFRNGNAALEQAAQLAKAGKILMLGRFSEDPAIRRWIFGFHDAMRRTHQY